MKIDQEHAAFSAWYEPNCPVDGVGAKEAAEAAWFARAALASAPAERPVAPSIFARMEDGRYAAVQAEEAIEEILGVELLGISFDDYDSSFEIFPWPDVADVETTKEQNDAILALGCNRFWINFPDKTERYCGGPRKASASNRYEYFNREELKRRAAPSPSADPAEQAPGLDAESLGGRPSVGQLRHTADRLVELAVRDGMFSARAIAERTKLWAMFDAIAAQPQENGAPT